MGLMEDAQTLNEFINDNSGYKGEKPDLSFINFAENLFKEYISLEEHVSHEAIAFLTKTYKRTLLLGQEFILRGYINKFKLSGLLVYHERIVKKFNKRNNTLAYRLGKIYEQLVR